MAIVFRVTGTAPVTVWVATGTSSTIAFSTNANTFSTYQLGDTTDTNLTAIAYGKGTSSGETMWMLGTGNSYVSSGSNPVAGAANWSGLDRRINQSQHRALQYGDNGDGVWVMATRAKVTRNVSGSWESVQTLNMGRAKGVANNGSGVWALATNVYNQGRPAIWKSLDDGENWAASWEWPTNYGINYASNKEYRIAYKSDQWVAVFPEAGIFTGSIGAGAKDNASFGRVYVSSQNMSYVAAGAANTWMAIDKARNVYVSTDDAATWSTTTALPGSDEPTSLAYYGGDWMVTTDGTENNIIKSSNNGASWAAIASTGVAMNSIAASVILP